MSSRSQINPKAGLSLGMNEELANKNLQLPLLPLRDTVIFPNMVCPLLVARKKSIATIEAAIRQGKGIVCVAQLDSSVENPKLSDLYGMGTLVKIPQIMKLADGSYKILVEGVCRAVVDSLNVDQDFYEIETLLYPESLSQEEDNFTLAKVLYNRFERYAKYTDNVSEEVVSSLKNVHEPGRLCDLVALNLPVSVAKRQEVLDTYSISMRLEKVVMILQQEIEWMKVDQRIHSRVKQRISSEQEKYFKHQKLRAIQEELGDNDHDPNAQDIQNFQNKLDALKLPEDIYEKATSELNKLKHTPPMSAEATVIRMYLEWIIDLPWHKQARINKDLKKAEKMLNQDHYGLDKVKDRILESLAVHTRVKKPRGPILCLVGPPGVGKTSLGKSVAQAIGRPFVRISLGGVRDESEIRGHRKTYIGAMPGRVVKAMKRAKVVNPLVMLDEIDKMGMDYRGDPASALLEVLDPEQNKHFSDHYLEVDYDLSDVLFLTTSNTLDIPSPLLDRMEIIRLPGYTETEKWQIAKRHLLPKALKQNGIKKEELKVSDACLMDMIRRYTKEAGVRDLSRNLDRVCRKYVRNTVGKKAKKTTMISSKSLKNYLGSYRYSLEKKHQKPCVGRIQGLAWTSVGGETLTIEVVCYPGKGELIQTGSLGDVMKESMRAALSVVRKHALNYGLDYEFFTKNDFHIHMPEGATPKDGPSAGIGISSALLSAATGLAIRSDVALTGEVTLNGDVLAIGGLKEKLLAAVRAEIKDVIIPKENEKDIDDLPQEVTRSLQIHCVNSVSDVFDKVLVSTRVTKPPLSSYQPTSILQDA